MAREDVARGLVAALKSTAESRQSLTVSLCAYMLFVSSAEIKCEAIARLRAQQWQLWRFLKAVLACNVGNFNWPRNNSIPG